MNVWPTRWLQMNSRDFQYWLKGFLEGKLGLNGEELQAVRDALIQVDDAKPMTMEPHPPANNGFFIMDGQ